MKSRSYGPLGLCLSTFLAISCASDNAAALREVRPNTIAANLGPLISFEHRPHKNIGIDLYAHSADNELHSGSFDLWESLGDSARDYKNRGTDIGLGASFYPFETSAFRTGLGLEMHNSTASFDSDTLDRDVYGFPGSTRASYKQSSMFLSIPLGWSWIWDSGFSFSLDYGPRIRLSRSTSWKNTGGSRVDQSFRDNYMNDKEDDKNVQFGGSGGFGYSF